MAGVRIGLVAGALVIALVSCGGADPGNSSGDLEGEVRVSAAASLTDVLVEMEAAFEQVNPGVDVVLNLAGSSALREQILEGAPADVFASANMSNMQQLVEAGSVAGEPVVFATNSMQIAVPAGNPAGITGLDDFSREELLIGLCAETVPCGDFARTVLRNAAVSPAVDTNEPDVRALLTKLELGELDAGITYVTDVASAVGLVEGIDIPKANNVLAEYPIAVLAAAPNEAAAEVFVSFVTSDEAEAILVDHGFAVP